MVVMLLHPKCAHCKAINDCFAMHASDGSSVIEPDSHTCLMLRGELCCEYYDKEHPKSKKRKSRR